MKRLGFRDTMPGEVDRINLRDVSWGTQTAAVNCDSDYLDRTELW